jgi:hypothetical protein
MSAAKDLVKDLGPLLDKTNGQEEDVEEKDPA